MGLKPPRRSGSRKVSTGRRMPIIAMTAHAMQGDRERCIEGGMDDYIAKPIRSGELMEVIGKYIYGTSEPTSLSSFNFSV